MKLQTRLSLTTVLTAVIALFIVLAVASSMARTALEHVAREKLSAVLAARYNALTFYLNDIENKLNILALEPSTKDSLIKFSEAFAQMGKSAQFHLQQKYVTGNRYPRAERDRFEITDELDAYDRIHLDYHALYRERYRRYSWDDLLLIDPEANVVYSTLKEKDFATNLRSGIWRNTGLARAVLPLLASPVPGVIGFADFTLYEPSGNQPAAFIALPVFDSHDSRFVGVIALQVPLAPLNELMNDLPGLGETGESFLVGQDGWMLTDSRFEKEHTALRKQLRTIPVKRVLLNETDLVEIMDYRNIPALVSFKPVHPFQGALGDHALWGLISKVDQDEALEGLHVLQGALFAAGVFIALLACIIGVWAARAVSNPILAIQSALGKLSRGEQAQVPGLERRDEIGNMATAVESFRLMSQQIERSHWLNEHLAELTNLVSSQFSMMEVPDTILDYLCQCLDVPVASLYFVDEQNCYVRVGMHGLARRSQVDDRFGLGAGLVGQCARDRQPIVLSPVPEGLAVISAGLAEFMPKELILYPVRHKDEVLAILELSALKSLTAYQHEFLLAACDGLGLHLANLKAAEHNLSLLSETRKQAEILAEQQQRIGEASRYARSLLEACLDPLVTINADGHIMDVNQATENVTGVSREQLIGSDFSQYFTDPKQASSGYQQVFSQGKVVDYPLAIRHISGRITDVLYNASIYYDAEGKVAGVFAAARDITEAKQQQETLRSQNEEMKALTEELKAQNEEFRANQEELRAQQEEMQHKNQLLEAQGRELEKSRQEAELKARELGRANRYKSDFLANMSHELRTPLNSILILAKNLSENDEGNLSAEQVESAMVINESGNHLLTLINDILDLSKIEAGRFELFSENFPLQEVNNYLYRAFMPLAEKKTIGFDIKVEGDLPESIYGDRQRITQVLTNLLSNAIKFTDTGEVQMLVRALDEELQFDIVDTGIGVPADKLDSIFGVFQQGDGSTSRKYGGSGLGLAISKRLIELMGGSISVLSTPGHGSTFSVRLPITTHQAHEAPVRHNPIEIKKTSLAPAKIASSHSDTPILIVEDDNRLVAILDRLIDTLGFAAVSVESGEKALANIAQAKPAGVLLDLGLPGMHGMEVLRQLKADSATADIPVFIMSGAEDTGEAKTLGALGFLKKPVTKDSIAAAIRIMLEENRAHAVSQTLLVVEDNQADILALQTLFRYDPIVLISMRTGAEALEWLRGHQADAIILDLMLPDISGFDWLRQLDELPKYPPIVVYSARELANEELFQLREYADAIVTKGTSNERLREEVLLILNTASQAPANENFVAKNRSLLVVDDDVRNLFALAKVLRRKGFRVEVAPDAFKALALIEQQSFDAVLSDIMMPEMDGYALIRRIRELGHDTLPLIAITAKAMPGDIDLCLQAGASDYVPKPVDVDKLLEVLERWL